MLYQTTNPHGGDVYGSDIAIDFSASINPLGIPQGVISAMKEALSFADHYPDPYCREAVSAISEYEGIPAEDILLGNGAAELIYAFCDVVKPRKALIAVPTFSEYETALRNNECRIIYHYLLRENDFALDSSFLSDIETHKPDVIILCDPNNPTGRLIDPHLMNEILSLCAKSGFYLFVDECFMELTGKSSGLNDCLGSHSGLFLLKALTKSYALAGIRVGYCLSSDHVLLHRMSQQVQPWNVSVIAQAAAAAAMKERDYLQNSVSFISVEREFLSAELQKSGFYVCPSDANFILFQAQAKLGDELRKKGVAIRSCENFSGLGCGWYRIAVRTHHENETLIRSIRAIVQPSQTGQGA